MKSARRPHKRLKGGAAETIMAVFESGGVRLAYERVGDPSAPAVLLLMGLGMPKEAWPASFVEGLVREGFQVVMPDNRDAGRSSKFDDWCPTQGDALIAIARTLLRFPVRAQYALEDMALDAERLLDGLGIRRVHVAGFSMGGMIAQVFASTCPNRAATLTVMSSAGGNPRTGLGELRAVEALLTGGRGGSPEAAREGYRRIFMRLSGPAWRPSEADLNRMIDVILSSPFDEVAVRRQLLAILASGDRTPQLRALRVPTLVMHGRADPLLPFRAGEEIAGLIPGARLIGYEGLGHQLPEGLTGEMAAALAGHAHAHPA